MVAEWRGPLGTTDDDVRDAALPGLVRLALWLGLNVTQRAGESEGAYRWRVGRSIQREEKKLRRLPKES